MSTGVKITIRTDVKCTIGYCPGCSTGSCPKIEELMRKLSILAEQCEAGDGVAGD